MNLYFDDDGVAHEYNDEFDLTIHCETAEELEHVKKLLKNIPRWISVSERMPEEREWIGTKRFATTKSGKVLITLVDNLVIDGNKKPYYGDRVVVCDHFENGKMRTKFHGTPIAWMPLPEPCESDVMKEER